ncbi:MAG: hypothetical protein BJ554DRAFT_3999, partial [Olpidium bornovanus]
RAIFQRQPGVRQDVGRGGGGRGGGERPAATDDHPARRGGGGKAVSHLQGSVRELLQRRRGRVVPPKCGRNLPRHLPRRRDEGAVRGFSDGERAGEQRASVAAESAGGGTRGREGGGRGRGSFREKGERRRRRRFGRAVPGRGRARISECGHFPEAEGVRRRRAGRPPAGYEAQGRPVDGATNDGRFFFFAPRRVGANPLAEGANGGGGGGGSSFATPPPPGPFPPPPPFSSPPPPRA